VNIIGSVDKVLNSKMTGITIFGLTGGFKMYSDYKKAPYYEREKRHFFMILL